jgi:transcriptional regulator with XRE-family HTH domain
VVEECPECGAEYPHLPAVADLHRAIMLDLLKKETLLSGEEIRFLRKMATLTASELAKLMGITNTQISKLENNARPISPTSDRVLRLICYSGLLERLVKGRDGSFVGETAAAAKQRASLDVKNWLKTIDRAQKGPKRVTIDPKMLSEFGCGISGSSDPVPVSSNIQ